MRSRLRKKILAVVFFFLPLLSAGAGTVNFFDGPPFPETLSQWGIFSPTENTLDLSEGVIPYDLNNPLFSDYTHKFRTLYLPPGSKAQYKEQGPLDFPVGTIFSKTFAYPNGSLEGIHYLPFPLNLSAALSPLKNHHWVETRLLVKTSKGWVGLPYVWNEEQTEAKLEITGKMLPLTWTSPQGNKKSFTYLIPNMNQCKSCHIHIQGFKKTTRPIGPTTANLNRNYPYPEGEHNQLAYWKRKHLLNDEAPAPEEAPRAAVWNDPHSGTLNQRARDYLEINCAHCHNAHGPAKTSHLFLERNVTDPLHYGVCKSPVAVGNAGGGLPFAIFPGRPEKSILVYRLDSEKVEVMMPELGRSLIHEEGVAVIKEWISKMEGSCRTPAPPSL